MPTVLTVLEPEVEVIEVPLDVPLDVPKPTMADIYKLAASLLDEYGWIQNSLGSKLHGFCAVGALEHASSISRGSAKRIFLVPLHEVTAYRGAMWNWNDAPGRTKEEVQSKLLEAAEWITTSGYSNTTSI